ncbi:hypothetical protein NC653_013627 [Populus alba x Populus x berolinensis]|uniref:Uncharacterized protein n=1 Tax=Populus alba x Populus x berolinensis TaxID=444605 RepID=A0AAD6W393_9ROSI|nr:hypothetical protein NC653_013627 [Populus alba x Populus x berolinensis]
MYHLFTPPFDVPLFLSPTTETLTSDRQRKNQSSNHFTRVVKLCLVVFVVFVKRNCT